MQDAPLLPDATGIPAAESVAATVDWLDLLARMHPALVHLPIGLVFALVLVELFGFGEVPRRLALLRRAMLFAATFSAALTATSGWFLGQPGSYDVDILFWHRWLSISVAGLLAVATLADLARWSAAWRRFGVFLASLLVVVAGHQGGSLTHGPNYLTRGAPEWMRRAVEWLSPSSYGKGDVGSEESEPAPDVPLERLEEGSSETGQGTADEILEQELPDEGAEEVDGDAALDSPPVGNTAAAVVELLEEGCFRCHGPRKRKAGLRLDQREGLLSVVTPGAAPDSVLYRRVSLPEDHEDVMPPSGPFLEDGELALLRTWINGGASLGGVQLPGDVSESGD